MRTVALGCCGAEDEQGERGAELRSPRVVETVLPSALRTRAAMPLPDPQVLFSSWRPLWFERDRSLRETAAVVDDLLWRRLRYRTQRPAITHLQLQELSRFREVRDELLTSKTASPALLEDARGVLLRIRPVVRAALWPRWLELEAALFAASADGDLLSGCLLLRAMIEDAEIRLLVEAANNRLDLADGGLTEEEIGRHVKLLWGFVLPRDRPRTRDELDHRMRHGLGHPSTELKKQYQALLDYVHPNYGSHLLALSPEDSQVGGVLLDAAATVYRCLLETLPPRGGRQSGWVYRGERRRWDDELEAFEKQTLPRLRVFESRRPDAAERSTVWIDGLEALLRGERATQEALDDWLLTERDSRRAADLCSLADQVETEARPHTPQGINQGSATLPMPLDERVSQFRFARLRENHLVMERLAVAARGADGTPSGVEFSKACVAFAALVLDAKCGTLRRRTISYLNAGSALGAAICARSYLEHLATLRRLADELQDGNPSPESLDRELARLLVATRGTREPTTRWSERLRDSGTPRLPGMVALVEETLGDSAGSFYHLLSQTAHGFTYTGGDLLRQSDDVVESALAGVAEALGMCHGKPASQAMYRLGQASDRMARVLRLLSTGLSWAAAWERVTLPGVLAEGHHYFGTGSLDDSFRFSSDLDYYEAYGALVAQKGLQGQRVLRQHGSWFLDEVVMPGGRSFFFAPPPHPGLEDAAEESDPANRDPG